MIGVGLAAITLATMPPLVIAKARVGEKLGSSATKSEGWQNMLCAYLSAALLVGLGANAIFGLWWADPITALLSSPVKAAKTTAAPRDGQIELSEGGSLPFSCNLVGEKQVRRREVAGGLLNGDRLSDGLDDRYEFAFPGDAGWAMRLTEFVVAERSCYPFFVFELVFEPEGGETLLLIRGPGGTEQFIGGAFCVSPSRGR